MDHIESGPFIDGSSTVVQIPKVRDTGVGEITANFFQTEAGTFAHCELIGGHGLRENIPAARKFFIASGRASFSIDGVDCEVEQGSIIVVPKGASFDFRSIGDQPVTFFVDIGFQMDLDTLPSPK